MGLLQQSGWFEAALSKSDLSAQQIDALIAERSNAKKDKDFARADEIRNELSEQGITLLDGPEGTTWEKN